MRSFIYFDGTRLTWSIPADPSPAAKWRVGCWGAGHVGQPGPGAARTGRWASAVPHSLFRWTTDMFHNIRYTIIYRNHSCMLWSPLGPPLCYNMIGRDYIGPNHGAPTLNVIMEFDRSKTPKERSERKKARACFGKVKVGVTGGRPFSGPTRSRIFLKGNLVPSNSSNLGAYF